MRVAIRTDASEQIGTGHFIRCLTLADALKTCGAKVCFISRLMPLYLRDKAVEKGHEFKILNGRQKFLIAGDLAHSSWLATSQKFDAIDTEHALSDQTWDWLVVDHYALDIQWESSLRSAVGNILVIDDIADRSHDCDVLLDQNFYADMDARYFGKVPAQCRLLLGPRYALLREEFHLARQTRRTGAGLTQRVLVFFGGIDKDNYTAQALLALAGIENSKLHVDVVIGAQNPHLEQVKLLCAEYDFDCHVQSDRMAELMSAADFSIGAGGGAIWERSCLGLPTLTICTAGNQRQQISDAASVGLIYAPELSGDLVGAIKRHATALMENSCLRQVISANSMRVVDGLGVWRVVTDLDYSDIEVREAVIEDSNKLFEWRNHPSVRAASRSADVIDWATHQVWLSQTLCASDRFLLIGHRKGSPTGVVRFDIFADEAEVSIYLVPDGKQYGQGKGILRAAERWLIANHPEVLAIRAHVMGGNHPSQRLFLRAHYEVQSTYFLKKIC